MEQILLAYGLSKENVTVIMLYKTHESKGSLTDTGFFDIVAGVLQGDTLAQLTVHNPLRQRTSNVDRSNERK